MGHGALLEARPSVTTNRMQRSEHDLQWRVVTITRRDT